MKLTDQFDSRGRGMCVPEGASLTVTKFPTTSLQECKRKCFIDTYCAAFSTDPNDSDCLIYQRSNGETCESVIIESDSDVTSSFSCYKRRCGKKL